MIRFGNLFDKIYDIENLKLAHENARKKKTHYKEVKKVDDNLEASMMELHFLLKNKLYKNSKYTIFKKKTDNGKIREIYKLPYFPDRIIHHAIIQIVEPIWKSTLIRDTHSSIKGRGIFDGVNRFKIALRDKENTTYCLKLDINKYYPSINNSILKSIIRKKIKDKNSLWLLDEIIDSVIGIPIGNYLSQYFGNLYLSELDHIMKNKLKYYFRYCDDIVILHKNKNYLHEIKIEIDNYLSDKRNLKLKSNWQLFPVSKRGVDFLGYRFFHNYMLLRRSIKNKFIKLSKRIKTNYQNMNHNEIINGLMSYYGWLKYGNCLNLTKKYLDNDIKNIFNNVCFENLINDPLKKLII